MSDLAAWVGVLLGVVNSVVLVSQHLASRQRVSAWLAPMSHSRGTKDGPVHEHYFYVFVQAAGRGCGVKAITFPSLGPGSSCRGALVNADHRPEFLTPDSLGLPFWPRVASVQVPAEEMRAWVYHLTPLALGQRVYAEVSLVNRRKPVRTNQVVVPRYP